ncbi:MAG TPA: DUF4139 domain-containing protein [Candidatus Binatia bacterium]|nr:DUF4139 domain-containing protein [Candidatus Binatia bacterium]
MKLGVKNAFGLLALTLAATLLLRLEWSNFGYAAGPAQSSNVATDLNDQETVSITVYNSNLGLVKDVRRLTLPPGITELKFGEVAAKIMPHTVHIKSLVDPSRLQVLEQNYEYDLLSPQKLLEKYVGKEITILKDGVEVPITILSTNQGLVYKLGGRIFTGHLNNLIFPQIPNNLIPHPTLVWLLENRSAGPQKVEATYLTLGMTWKADYVAVLDGQDKIMDLNGWVTLDNQSGATYQNARLKLVAGDVNRVLEEHRSRDAVAKLEALSTGVAAASAFAEQSFFEYHLYSLQRPTTIKSQQTKQVTLLSSDNIPVTKRYFYYGARQYLRQRHGVPVSDQKVGVYVEIANKKDHRLGMPLPKGIVRVYKADSDGSLQFIGEDRIDHTPKDETIKIKMGNAFDIVGERKQIDWRKIADHLYEVAFEISLRNHKDEPVTVSVIEPMLRDWEILNSSHAYEKIEAHTVKFDIPVAKDGETKLRYRARFKF